ncbi:MAG: hypothetical protein N3G20_05585, partial [Verrucomicrobiae bacterium]|nr:hypothetical protein [Verrucomicrobiae bacterium]
LSWPVDRVLVAGDYLIEAEEGSEWSGPVTPVLRVAGVADPEAILSEVALDSAQRLVGMSIRDGVLYVLQATDKSYVMGNQNDGDLREPKSNVTLSAFSLAGLPRLGLLAKTAVSVSAAFGYGDFKALWPKPGVVVWASSGGMGPWLVEVMKANGGFVDGIASWWWPRWGAGGGLLVAFNTTGVESKGRLRFLSVVDLASNGRNWNFSEAFQAGELVYLSHRSSFFVTGAIQTTPSKGSDTSSGAVVESGYWQTQEYLDVVDYSDPENPTVRPPVQIPAQLRGLGPGGSLLYTIGYRFDSKGETDWTEWVDALAYDGVSVSLVASLRLPTEWPRPAVICDNTVFIGRPETGSSAGSIEAWVLSTQGETAGSFVMKDIVKLDIRAQEMASYGGLLVVSTDGRLGVWDARALPGLRLVGVSENVACVWVDISKGGAVSFSSVWFPLREYGLITIPLRLN